MEPLELPAALTKFEGGWMAKCFSIERVADTVTNTRSGLQRAICLQMTHIGIRHYRRGSGGTVFCLYYLDGWRLDRFTDTVSTMLLSVDSELEAVQAMRDQIAAHDGGDRS